MADERHDFVMRELARVDDALHAAEEALGLLFLDFEPGTLTLQHAAWQQVRAVLGMPILPYPAAGVTVVPPSPAMDPQRLRELADPSHAAFEEAMRQTFQMVDPFNPPPPGSYARGSHEGICAALKTMRENYDRARRAAGVGEVNRA